MKCSLLKKSSFFSSWWWTSWVSFSWPGLPVRLLSLSLRSVSSPRVCNKKSISSIRLWRMLSFQSSFKRRSATISWKFRAQWVNKMSWLSFSARSQIHCAFLSSGSFSRISCARKTRPLQTQWEKYVATRTKEKTWIGKNLWDFRPQLTSNRAKPS